MKEKVESFFRWSGRVALNASNYRLFIWHKSLIKIRERLWLNLI